MFKVMIDERWFDHEDGLPEGVRVLMGPVDEDADEIADEVFKAMAVYDGDIVDFQHDDTRRAIRAHDIALMAACIRDWEGVGNAQGTAKLGLTIEGTRGFMAQRQVFGAMWQAFLQPYHYRLAEKNVSAPLPSDTSDGAESTVSTTSAPEPLPDALPGTSLEPVDASSGSAA